MLRENWTTNDPRTKYVYYYTLSDHLGNARIVMNDDQDAELVQSNSYSAFGLLAMGPDVGAGRYNNRFFLGRENQEGTGWVDLMKRMYNPSIGRFMTVDPSPDVAGQESLSPYQYGWNNPILRSDPNGDCPVGEDCTGTRIWGGLKAIGGAVEATAGVVGGVATSWTGVGAVAGGVAALHGADTFQSGIRQLWTGETTESFTHQGIATGAKILGASESTANNIATGGDLALGFVGGGASTLAKAGTKIEGVAQTTGTLGHATVSNVTAYAYALNPKVAKVTMDLGLKKLIPGASGFKYGPRPDVGVLFKDGTARAIEVASKSDNVANLTAKYANVQTTLSRQGTQLSTSTNSMLKNIYNFFGYR